MEPDTFINVDPTRFDQHMNFMHRRGYVSLTFAETVKVLTGKMEHPGKCFCVTFDDGYSCVGKYAAPILKKYGFSATVFIVTSGVGKSNIWDASDGRKVLPLLDWATLRQLKSDGWEIAGHTQSHPHLNSIDDSMAISELSESRRLLEEQIRDQVETFCYPYGDYAEQTPTLVRDAGYTGACTTKSGIASSKSNPYLLPRVKISHSDGVYGLIYKLYLRPLLPTMKSRATK